MAFLSEWLLYFAFYSFLGWLCESIYCSIPAKRVINRGFLNGPFCPIYGVGALLVIELLRPIGKNAALVFLFGTLLTSALEYLTGYLLEKLFHTKWWDYSGKRYQIRGRVCLKNSLLFGLLCVVLILLIQPLTEVLMNRIPAPFNEILAAVLLVYLIVDTAVSVRTVLQLNGKLQQMYQLLEEIEDKKEAVKQRIQQSVEQRLDDQTKDRLDRLLSKIKELEQNSKLAQRRLMSAFPHMRSHRYQEPLLRIKQAIEARRPERKEKK